MTTIAWDGNTLAADKQTSIDGSATTTTKIVTRNIGYFGFSGDYDRAQEIIDWVDEVGTDREFPKLPEDSDYHATVLLITVEDGVVYEYRNSKYPLVIENEFYAIGSGAPYAMAAMHCNKTAEEAVKIANIYDIYSGGGVDVIDVH